MAKEYIEREAFVAEKRKFYCEDCNRRKSMKDESKFVYDIGDAPCRACDIDDMIDAVEDFPAADVRPVVLCCNCEHYKTFGCNIGCGWCEAADKSTYDDFFCASGCRKSNGADMRESFNDP